MTTPSPPAFCPPSLLPVSRGIPSTPATAPTMRKSRPSRRPGPQGPARLPDGAEDKFENLASRYNIKAPAPGAQFDRKYNSRPAPSSPPSAPQTLYQTLAAALGDHVLLFLEQALYVVLAALLLAFIGGGLAISSEAFLKATGREVPTSVEHVLQIVQTAFTPVGVLFLLLSSVLGIYKQSQLKSGATSYEELRKGKGDN